MVLEFVGEIRHAARVLARSPGVTTFTIISLALGIGANTAIFSLINALMLRPLAVPDPRPLVLLSTISQRERNGIEPLSLAMLEEIRGQQKVFTKLSGWMGNAMANLEANGALYAGTLDMVDGEFFATLGVRPVLGRLIAPDDVAGRAGTSARVAVLDYRCWQRRYHGDQTVVGKTIRVNGIPFTIIGVTPEHFRGVVREVATEVTAPFHSFARRNRSVLAIARLRPGVALPQARAQLDTLWPGVLAASVPPDYQGAQRDRFLAQRLEIKSGAAGVSFTRDRHSGSLAALMGLVALVLLIACVNLANLMLARTAARRHETAVRAALGAGRWRLLRPWLVESLLLSSAGAAAGLLVAVWMSRVLWNSMWTGFVPSTMDVGPDGRILAFTGAVAVLTAMIFGLAPAWRRVADVSPALEQNARTTPGGIGGLSRWLVSVQAAMSLVLVTGAVLFARSLDNLRSFDPGFRRDRVLLMQLFPQPGREKLPHRVAYYRELAERLSRLPGVQRVSYSHMGPASGEFKQPVSAAAPAGASLQAVTDYVGPGFFDLIGMRVIAGREFNWADDERAGRVAVISESLARGLFPSRDPLGRKIDAGSRPEHTGLEVVGVVNNARLWKIQSREPMAVYIPLMQEPDYNQPMIDLRTAGEPSTLAPVARRTLESMGHHYPLRIETLEERAEGLLTGERLIAVLSAFFGGLALLLASLGLYGLLSYSVTLRTAEIGVRMALGARSGKVQALILRQAAGMILAGIAAGVPAVLALSRLVSGLLFGLEATDPGTIALAATALVGVALLASWAPARRAARMDPLAALRRE